MHSGKELTLEQQNSLIAALQRPAAFGEPVEDVVHLQTHISHVILAGDYAYKIKKPLDLGFLDFSSLERRRFCCEEELRLNRRLASELYLDVVPVTGSLDDPRFGGVGTVLEYAVRMRRFAQSDLLSESLPEHETLQQLAQMVAEFHQTIPPADDASPYGRAELVLHPMLENFTQIREIGLASLDLPRLDPLEAWTRTRGQQLTQLMEQRKQAGHIRECHGDMHLGNITRYAGRLQIFDGIEFNPNLSWIDTLNDIAFLLMDLQHRGLASEASGLLNAYLEQSGDYPALPLLRFYQLYRAMVRAKVAAIRLAQAGLSDSERQAISEEYTGYIALAEGYTQGKAPTLLITHGLSGSGKSLFGGWLADRLGAVRLRSDVERQRLFPQVNQPKGLAQGIYSTAATRTTYAHLRELAASILQAGHSVVVDATFLKLAQREQFQQLASDLGLSYRILDCVAPEELLRERVQTRQQQGGDPSEADLQVLEMQIGSREPLNAQELPHRVVLDTRDFPPQGVLEQLLQHQSG